MYIVFPYVLFFLFTFPSTAGGNVCVYEGHDQDEVKKKPNNKECLVKDMLNPYDTNLPKNVPASLIQDFYIN